MVVNKERGGLGADFVGWLMWLLKVPLSVARSFSQLQQRQKKQGRRRHDEVVALGAGAVGLDCAECQDSLQCDREPSDRFLACVFAGNLAAASGIGGAVLPAAASVWAVASAVSGSWRHALVQTRSSVQCSH